jgi:dTDP-4-dehydrorhamnose reductase
VIGARGRLGRTFVRASQVRGLAHVALTRSDVDITDEASVAGALERLRPWAVVNAAGYVDVDGAERDPRCERENALGAVVVARAAASAGAKLVTFSSDLVFDGRKRSPYVESDRTAPLGAYGRSKERAERDVAAADPSALIVRTSAFFGLDDEHDFIAGVLRSLAARRPVRAAEDVVVSPTYLPDLADTVLDLVIDDESGVWHLACPDAVSWADLARRAAALCGAPADLIRPTPARSLSWVAPRPAFSALASERADHLPCLDDALSRYARESRVAGQAVRAAA